MSEANCCVSPFGTSGEKKGPFANLPFLTLQSHPGEHFGSTTTATPLTQSCISPRGPRHSLNGYLTYELIT